MTLVWTITRKKKKKWVLFVGSLVGGFRKKNMHIWGKKRERKGPKMFKDMDRSVSVQF